MRQPSLKALSACDGRNATSRADAQEGRCASGARVGAAWGARRRDHHAVRGAGAGGPGDDSDDSDADADDVDTAAA